MSQEEDKALELSAAFSADVSSRHAVLLSCAGTISAVKEARAPGAYVSPHNDRPVDAWILIFEDGNAFVSDPSAFREIRQKELNFYRIAGETFKQMLVELATVAKAQGIEFDVFRELTHAALVSQDRELTR